MMLSLLLAPLFPTGNPLRFLFASATRSLRALQIVQDGRVIYSMPSSDSFRMPGPGILVIRSGNAGVLERSGKITRIVGPGFYLTEAFEHLSAIVDLSLQSESWDLQDVLTKDSVPLEVEFTVQYRIMIDQPALITKAEYRLDEEAMRRAVLTTADWNEQTKVVAESVLRDTIATRFLDEIYDPRSLRFSSGATPRVPLQHELRRRLGRESQRWGVEIVRVTLDKITLPREVKQRMVEAWDVAWHDVVEVARALTEAEAITAKAIGKGRAAYVEAVNSARARLEAAGIDRFVKLLDAEGAAWAEQRAADIGQRTKWLEARGAAIAELEAAEVGRQVAEANARRAAIEAQAKAGARMIEATGEALGELEAAKVGREIAEAEGEQRVIQAQAEANAQIIEGRAKAAAEAERFREVLLSLQRDSRVDDETLRSVIIQLAGVLTTVTDLQAFVRLLGGGRFALPGTRPARIIGNEGVTPDQE
jgi:regulator of protease activity HflC (stomatin/prohibitin superfamily)